MASSSTRSPTKVGDDPPSAAFSRSSQTKAQAAATRLDGGLPSRLPSSSVSHSSSIPEYDYSKESNASVDMRLIKDPEDYLTWLDALTSSLRRNPDPSRAFPAAVLLDSLNSCREFSDFASLQKIMDVHLPTLYRLTGTDAVENAAAAAAAQKPRTVVDDATPAAIAQPPFPWPLASRSPPPPRGEPHYPTSKTTGYLHEMYKVALDTVLRSAQAAANAYQTTPSALTMPLPAEARANQSPTIPSPVPPPSPNRLSRVSVIAIYGESLVRDMSNGTSSGLPAVRATNAHLGSLLSTYELLFNMLSSDSSRDGRNNDGASTADPSEIMGGSDAEASSASNNLSLAAVNEAILSLLDDVLSSTELPPTPDEDIIRFGLAALARDAYVREMANTSSSPTSSLETTARHGESVRKVFTTAFKLGILSPPDKDRYVLAGVKALASAAMEGERSGKGTVVADLQHDLILGAVGQMVLGICRSQSLSESSAVATLKRCGLPEPPSHVSESAMSAFAHNWLPPESFHVPLLGACLEALVNNGHYGHALRLFDAFFANDKSNETVKYTPTIYVYESALRACVALSSFSSASSSPSSSFSFIPSKNSQSAASTDTTPVDPLSSSKKLFDRMAEQFGSHVANKQNQFPRVSYEIDEVDLNKAENDSMSERGSSSYSNSRSPENTRRRRERNSTIRSTESDAAASDNSATTVRPGLPWSVIELHLCSLANSGDWEGCTRLFDTLLLRSEVASNSTSSFSTKNGPRVNINSSSVAASSSHSGIEPSTNFFGKDYVGFEQHPFGVGDNWNFALCVGHVVHACVKAGHPSYAYLLCHRLGLFGADRSSLNVDNSSDVSSASVSSPLFPSNESVSLLCCDYVLSGIMESLIMLKRGDSALTIFEAAVQMQQQRVDSFVHPLDQLRAHSPVPGSFGWRAASGGRQYSFDPNIATWMESVLIATKALSDLDDLESASALLRGLEVPANGNTKGLLNTYEALAIAYFEKSEHYHWKVIEAYDLASVRVKNPYCKAGEYQYFGSATLSEYAARSAAKTGSWSKVEEICKHMYHQQSGMEPAVDSNPLQPSWHGAWRPSNSETVLALCRSYGLRNKEDEGEHLLQALVPRSKGLVDGKCFEAVFNAVGHKVRRPACRGAPIIWDSSSASQTDRDEFERHRKDAYERLLRIKTLCEKAGMIGDANCVAGLARALRALRCPEDIKLLIESMIRKQVVPKAGIFTHGVVSAIENGEEALADKIIDKMAECGYEWQGLDAKPRIPSPKESISEERVKPFWHRWRSKRNNGEKEYT